MRRSLLTFAFPVALALTSLLCLGAGPVFAGGRRVLPDDLLDGRVARGMSVAQAHAELARTQAAAGNTGPGAGAPIRYVIGPGENLTWIAAHFGLSHHMLAETNGIAPEAILSLGQEIVIPWYNEAGTAVMGTSGPEVKAPGLHFVASISEQHCWLFRDRTVTVDWVCSTGKEDVPSIPGNYTIQSKVEAGFANATDFWMPYWLGIYDAGKLENGIHGIPFSDETGEKVWLDELGTPVTWGCIMLADDHAKELFDIAYIGMPVTILD